MERETIFILFLVVVLIGFVIWRFAKSNNEILESDDITRNEAEATIVTDFDETEK